MGRKIVDILKIISPLLFIGTLFLGSCFIFAASATTANISEGALIRQKGDSDVYIVKYVGDKKFKRLILSPAVFNSYGHLKWENIMDVDKSIADSFTTSDLVSATVAGDPRVYKLYPSGDVGEKRWIKTAEIFNALGYDWDAIYTINETDRNSYSEGTPVEQGSETDLPFSPTPTATPTTTPMATPTSIPTPTPTATSSPVPTPSPTPSSLILANTTFIKTYHLWDKTEGLGVMPVKDGGYLLAGDVISGMGVYYPFIIKTDDKGNVLWSERSGSSSNVYSISSSRHIGRIAVETTDGNIVMVSDTLDFIDAEYEKVRESYGDVLITELNSMGTKLWSIMLGDYSTDQPQRLWALPDGGVMLLARFSQTGYGNDVADTSAVPKHSVLVKIDKNGQVLMSKKMSWDAIDMTFLADGSFVALANIAIPQAEESQIMGTITAMAPLPTILKLNSALNMEWAKTIEMIPSELSVPSITSDGSLNIGVTKIRMPGGDFKEIQPTPDGGFLAFGYASLLADQGMHGTIGGQQLMQSATLRPFIAVKVDATGKYLWARKLTGSLFGGTTAIDFQTAKTIDEGFVILQEVVRDKNWQTYYDKGDIKALDQAWATNIELIKTDADFNPRWVKKIDVERDLSGYDLQPTADGGVVATGIILTIKEYTMIGGSKSPYEETALIKVDVNGGVSGCAAVSDHPEATVEDQSQYLIMRDMNVAGAKDVVFDVNKKVNVKVSTIENTARDICEYQKNNAVPISSYLNSNVFISQPGGSITSPVAKTWVQINFENAKEGKIESEKNQQIHEELLPILNQIFNNQVKMIDSMNGMWLTYYFSRLTTRADVEAAQKYYEGLGYKIDESEGGLLYVSKVGLTLHMTFSINNKMEGKLEVLF